MKRAMFRLGNMSTLSTVGFKIRSTVLICLVLDGLLTQEIITERHLNGSLTNMKILKDKIYIGGTDKIYVLNDDMSLNQTGSTCNKTTPECGNVNKVLLLDELTRKAYICGTGMEGFCESRPIDAIGKETARNTYSEIKVSTDINRPATGLITGNDNIMMGVTYGHGINTLSNYNDALTYEYPLSTLETSHEQNSVLTYLPLELHVRNLSEYLIYYEASFQTQGYSYFLTNQKEYVGSSNYITRLVRICQNDTYFRSYTDIFVNCEYNGKTYNLLQDAILIDPPSGYNTSESIFVGAFTHGNDPENPEGETILCLTKLETINNKVMEAKKYNALTCTDQKDNTRYLSDYKRDLCIPESVFRYSDFGCPSAFSSFRYTIGNVTVRLTQSYEVKASHGVVTALHGSSGLKNNLVLMTGTSKGQVLQLYLQSDTQRLELYNTFSADAGVRIQGIYQYSDNKLLVMSDRKVMMFSSTNCSEFRTCSETKSARNPLCGWCVREDRSTRKNDCSNATNHWLSSLEECVSITIQPMGIDLFRNQSSTSITVTVTNLPSTEIGDIYNCTFNIENEKEIYNALTFRLNQSSFTCTSPTVKGPTKARIGIVLIPTSGQQITLSDKAYYFYVCANFTSCGDCVNTTGVQCEWCSERVSCQQPSMPCMSQSPVSEVHLCPSVMDSRGKHFIPNGVLTNVSFIAKNLPVISSSFNRGKQDYNSL